MKEVNVEMPTSRFAAPTVAKKMIIPIASGITVRGMRLQLVKPTANIVKNGSK